MPFWSFLAINYYYYFILEIIILNNVYCINNSNREDNL